MTEKQLKCFTRDFPEVKELIAVQKSLKKEINKANKRLNTNFKKFNFLSKIVEIGINDDELEENLKMYFKNIGFEQVNKVGKHLGEEDLRIIQPDKTIIVETTGIKKLNPTDDKTRQITKHLAVRKSMGENVFGLFVLHSENLKPIKERQKIPFTKKQIEYANADKYGLVTTIDLLFAFKLIKTNKLTFKEFENKICSQGHITF